MVLLPGLVVPEREASVVGVVATAAIVDPEAEAVTETTGEVDMTEDPVERTTNRWAVGIDATAAGTVGMAGTTTHESVATKATVTTIRDNEGSTELVQRPSRAFARVCQGYLLFFHLIISHQ